MKFKTVCSHSDALLMDGLIKLLNSGDLTRDQLSSLLITNLGTASDIVDFYSILDESQTKQENDTMDLIYVILVFWTWSLLQVCDV